MKTEFNILEITRSASWDEIKKAYRDKMKQSHPDLNCENTMMVQQANQKSKDINAAYSKLKSCLSQTGRFICPTFDFKKTASKPKPNEPMDLHRTNVADFFKPRDIVAEAEAERISWGSVCFNLFLIALWAGVLILGTIKGMSYFETHSIASLGTDLKGALDSLIQKFS